MKVAIAGFGGVGRATPFAPRALACLWIGMPRNAASALKRNPGLKSEMSELVAGALDSALVVLLKEDGTDEAGNGGLVGEDADCTSTPWANPLRLPIVMPSYGSEAIGSVEEVRTHPGSRFNAYLGANSTPIRNLEWHPDPGGSVGSWTYHVVELHRSAPAQGQMTKQARSGLLGGPGTYCA